MGRIGTPGSAEADRQDEDEYLHQHCDSTAVFWQVESRIALRADGPIHLTS
jgi:hypothetical protein